MHIIGITVCVDYSDYLAATIDSKLQCCDTLIVATVDSDAATRQLIEINRRKHPSNDFKIVDGLLPRTAIVRNEACFNKSHLVSESQSLAYRLCHAESIKNPAFLLIDADIFLPANARDIIIEHATDKEALYGVERLDFATPARYHSKIGVKYRQKFAGYFQLYFEPKHYPAHSIACDKCDVEFASQFKRKVLLPLTVGHIGPERVNWKGRVSEPWVS